MNSIRQTLENMHNKSLGSHQISSIDILPTDKYEGMDNHKPSRYIDISHNFN